MSPFAAVARKMSKKTAARLSDSESSRLVSNHGAARNKRVSNLRQRIAVRGIESRSKTILCWAGVFCTILVVLILLYVGTYVEVTLSHNRLKKKGNTWTAAGEVQGCRDADTKIETLSKMADEAAEERHFARAAKLEAQMHSLESLCREFVSDDDDEEEGARRRFLVRRTNARSDEAAAIFVGGGFFLRRR